MRHKITRITAADFKVASKVVTERLILYRSSYLLTCQINYVCQEAVEEGIYLVLAITGNKVATLIIAYLVVESIILIRQVEEGVNVCPGITFMSLLTDSQDD